MPRIKATRETPDKKSSECSSLDSYLPSPHRYPDGVLFYAPSLWSSRGSDYGSGPDRADWRARGRLAEPMQREIDAQDAGERSAVPPCIGINLCNVRNAREHLPRSAEVKRDRDEDLAQFPDSIGQCRPPRASAGGLSPSPLIVSRYHVAREPSDETTSNGPSLGGSRSTSLSHFAMVPSAAPLPLSPSSATPRILGARKPPDKNSDRSSANSCQPARRSHPASVLSSIPLPRSSRRPKGASEPDSAHWRVREWPAALNVPRCKIGVNSWGVQNREWLSPRLDVADTAAPSTSRRHLHAFKREHVLKPLENGASDLKRTHAGGRTVFLSWKRVKPLDAHGEKKESPQLTASDTMCQRSPSLELDQAMPPTGARGDLVLGCDGRDIGILHAEKLPCVTLHWTRHR
ncbi:hypothetical protein EV121DRAFT_298078 [Schizophyllum commune]